MTTDHPPARELARPPAAEARPQRLAVQFTLLLPATAAMYSVFQGMQAVLLPQQVEQLGGENKVSALAVLAALGALIATVFGPIAGAVSDRTRSRFGRRAPWLLVTPVLAALGLLLLAGQRQYFLLGAVYCLVMLVMGCYQAVITAIVPDRVPVARRGAASAVVGIALPVGVLFGVNMVSRVFTTPVAGYAVLGGTLVLFALLFVFLTKDQPVLVAPPRRRGNAVATFFSSFRVADFSWAFAARALYMFGYWGIASYLLYTLQDYVVRDSIPGGNPVAAVGTLTSVGMIALLIGTFLGGWLSDLLERRKAVVIASSLICAVALVIPLMQPTFTGMLVFEAINGFGFGAYLAADTALMTLVLPGADDNGRDLGILNVAATIPQVLAQFVGALVITFAGGYPALFVFSIVCSILGAAAIIPIKSVR
ncbi:MFS transporter [Amycolatopsis jejuensis]|uniref:MFS transporter n=1 Tax=Amycolatopsis jejuensis TaxID=330084 RepID=UPI000525B3E4|nr:MFS transporter [Amycolatopsis jejuensis]